MQAICRPPEDPQTTDYRDVFIADGLAAGRSGIATDRKNANRFSTSGLFRLTSGIDLTNGIYHQTKSINVGHFFAHYANTEAIGGDSVMSIRKNATSEVAVRLPQSKLPIGFAAVLQQRLVQEVEITSLEIEQDPDQGSDPYNRTGQFCIVGISKEQ